MIGGMSIERLAVRLAGFSSWLEVIEPAEVRAQLRAIGAQLVATYG